MVAQKELIGRFVHLCERFAQVGSVAVCGDVVQLRDRQGSTQRVDVLFAVELKQNLWIGEGFKRHRIKQGLGEEIVDFAAHKAILYNGCIAHAVCGEDHAAGLGDANGFRKRLFLFFAGKEVIHRPKKQRDIVGLILKEGQIACVALTDSHLFAGLCVLIESLDVVLDQFYRIDGISLACEGMTVTSCRRADFQDAHFRRQVFVNVGHGGQVFDVAVAREKTAVFIVLAVILREVVGSVHGYPSFLNIKKQYGLKIACTAFCPLGTVYPPVTAGNCQKGMTTQTRFPAKAKTG